MKLKKGDQVLITAGKDIGKKGKIDRLLDGGKEVLLPSLNINKRHLKKRSERQQGGIIEFSKPLPIANIALICPKCHQPTRVGWTISPDSKQRICRKCKNII